MEILSSCPLSLEEARMDSSQSFQSSAPAWGAALWRQFGAALAMLENALVACPDDLWVERLWPEPPGLPPAPFWYLSYHVLFWTDLYLSGPSDAWDSFAPPTPFTRGEPGSDEIEGPLPEQPYSREAMLGYLAYVRQIAQQILTTLTDEQAGQPFIFPWKPEHPVSSFELHLYNLRHIQEHAAQLSVFLGQHGVPGEALDWVMWAPVNQ
jgi:hypothetical protein